MTAQPGRVLLKCFLVNVHQKGRAWDQQAKESLRKSIISVHASLTPNTTLLSASHIGPTHPQVFFNFPFSHQRMVPLMKGTSSADFPCGVAEYRVNNLGTFSKYLLQLQYIGTKELLEITLPNGFQNVF